MKVGAVRLTNYARMFGFGKTTGIGLPGEEEGILFNPQEMRDSDLATMSIGTKHCRYAHTTVDSRMRDCQ